MVLSELAKLQQNTADNLNPTDTVLPIVKQHTEILKVEEGPSKFTDTTEGHGWIVGSSTNGIVGTNTGTYDSSQQVVGGAGRVTTTLKVYNSNNRFIERFNFDTFINTGSTTATKVEDGVLTVDNCDAVTGWSNLSDTTITLNSTTYIEGTGAINHTKSGTGGDTAAIDKTVTSRDFTDQDLYLFVYIKDNTTLNKLKSVGVAIGLRHGSDGANNYAWDIARSELSLGWNKLGPYNISNVDGTNGSPVDAACDYMYIAFFTNNSNDTWSAGDVIFDYIYYTIEGTYSYYAFNNGDIIQSNSIYLDTDTITKAILTVSDSTNLTLELSADGGSNYETVTNNTEHSFTDTGTELLYKLTATGNALVTFVESKYN